MTSAGTAALLLPAKSVVVYRNGDPFFSGRRFVVNQRQVATMEAFLNDVTHSIQAPLAVRTLYTPRQGHRVSDLLDLQTGAQYVAAGFERFKKLDYLNTGLKRVPVNRTEAAQARVLNRPNVSAKWRKIIPLPCVIHVFRNGDLLSPPFRFIVPRNVRQGLEQILILMTEKASLRTGAVRRLCTLEGVMVTAREELESGQYYVAVGMERFKKLPYVALLVSKATGGSADRHFAGNRRLEKRYERRKAVPRDTHSDSALLNSPELDGRRVKSTGDQAEGDSPSQAVQKRPGQSVREESSIFYAKPVRVRKNRAAPRPPPRAGKAQPSVFKGSVSRRRQEVQGAEEVPEDQHTAVELPVDQRVAETVEDEELNGKKHPERAHRDQTRISPEQKQSSTADSRPSPSSREEDIKESSLSATEGREMKISLEHEAESCEPAAEQMEEQEPATPNSRASSSSSSTSSSPSSSASPRSQKNGETCEGSPHGPETDRTAQPNPVNGTVAEPESQERPASSASKERPASSASKERPGSSASQERPASSARQEL